MAASMRGSLKFDALSADLELAIHLALDAGAAIERVREAGFEARDKRDLSPVTEADLAADRIITEGLRRERPTDGLLSEESGGCRPGPGGAIWCVDPLDGTEAFIDGMARGYAVQIAKLVLRDGSWEPVLGVVFEPRHDELFFAESGRGAWAVLRGGPPVRLERKREPRNAPRVVTSTRIEPGLREGLFARGYGDGGRLRSVGVKVARLLLDEAELYLATHPLSYWDLAAPQVLLEVAGGVVSDSSGARPRYLPLPEDGDGVPTGAAQFRGPLALSLGLDHERALADVREVLESK